MVLKYSTSKEVVVPTQITARCGLRSTTNTVLILVLLDVKIQAANFGNKYFSTYYKVNVVFIDSI